MKRIVPCVVASAVMALGLSFSASAQRARGYASQQASSAPADFTEGNLKFHRSSSGFMQVTDTEKNQTAGTVIFPPNQPPMFAPMPGYDIKSAYEKHMNGGAEAAPAHAAPDAPPPATAAVSASLPPARLGWNAASKTMTMQDASVKFTDEEHLTVTVPGAAGDKTYDVIYHKGSVGRFMRSWAQSARGNTGTGSGAAGPAGGGVEIDLAASNGTPGGKLWDTADGENRFDIGPTVERIRPVINAVNEAVKKTETDHPEFKKWKVVKALLDNYVAGATNN